MLGEHYGDDLEYADSRVRGTVVKHGNVPVYVEGLVRENNSHAIFALVRNLQTDLPAEIPLKELDLCPFRLGYVNYRQAASYICRMPKRRDYKQGMRHQNICSQYGYHSSDIPYGGFVNTIMGVFPTFSECINAVVNSNKELPIESMAWDNNWAVDNEGNILYKFGEVVGVVKEGKPVLLDNKQHLMQALKESLKC